MWFMRGIDIYILYPTALYVWGYYITLFCLEEYSEGGKYNTMTFLSLRLLRGVSVYISFCPRKYFGE